MEFVGNAVGQIAVHFIGGNVVEALDPCFMRRIEQRYRSFGVHPEEQLFGLQTGQRSVDMGFSEMDHTVDTPHDLLHRRIVLDVGGNEFEPGIVRALRQAVHVARIGQFVDHHDLVPGMPAQPVVDEVRPDESRTPSYQESHVTQSFPCCS